MMDDEKRESIAMVILARGLGKTPIVGIASAGDSEAPVLEYTKEELNAWLDSLDTGPDCE